MSNDEKVAIGLILTAVVWFVIGLSIGKSIWGG